MKKRTEWDPYEGRPEEVGRKAIGWLSDGIKPTWVSSLPLGSTLLLSLPAGTMGRIQVKKTPPAASCKVIPLFGLNCEAPRKRALSLQYH